MPLGRVPPILTLKVWSKLFIELFVSLEFGLCNTTKNLVNSSKSYLDRYYDLKVSQGLD